MENKDLWILLGKRLNGEITEQQRASLERLIHESDEDISYLIEFLEETWQKKTHRPFTEDQKVSDQWQKLSDRLGYISKDGEKLPKRFWRRNILILKSWYKIAGCLVVFLAVGFYFRSRFNDSTMGKHEIIVAKGKVRQVQLPDGTSVWLNGGSRLWYKGRLGTRNREVWLEGEAFFKVTNDAAVPFTVNASSITVEVLGTNFNVKAYKGDPDIQTTLISGRIQVLLNNDPDKKVLLSPHEKLTVMSGGSVDVKSVDQKESTGAKSLQSIPRVNALKYQVQVLPLNPTDSSYFTETAWVRNELAFVYQPFSEVAKQMERRYNVHIIFKDSSLAQVVMTGVFDKETVDEALDVLKMITRFSYTRINDSIYIDR